MKKRALFAVLFIFSVCAGLRAQTFSLITGREPVTSLDGLWRFHTGDNPAWASPEFDDSQWALLCSDEDWGKQGYRGYSGFAWYRFRVAIPAGLEHVSLLLPPMRTSYQVYVDGKLTGAFSQMPPHSVTRIPLPAEYPLNMGKTPVPREATVALRVWHWQGWSGYWGGGPQNGGALVGQSSIVNTQFQRQRDSQLLSNGGSYSLGLLASISGTIALLLFLVRRKETEYLWFALNQLADAIVFGLGIYGNVEAVPIISKDYAIALLDLIAGLSFIFFLQKLLRGRRSVLFYLAIAAASALPVLELMLLFHLWPSIGSLNLTNAVFSLAIFVWSCDLLVRRAKEGLPDARLLLAPVLIALGLASAEEMFWGAFQLGWLKVYYRPFILFNYPFPFPADDLIEVLFLIAMLAILTHRFMRSRREEQRLAGELEAARSVQSLLVPATALSTPGFAVESVYLPASEVGGDFFQVLPGDDGSLLIVVGDVSGKGLKAAMTVSTIIGALRGCTLRAPAEVLAYLNHVLGGQVSGFVTCCVALIGADGQLTIANAGHLSPYRNGQEMTIHSGLPLGIVADGSYQEMHSTLAPGDRLTFVSDGVVEARDKTGALFGFERAAALTLKPAHEIADTARDFGQQDDITVLTLARTA